MTVCASKAESPPDDPASHAGVHLLSQVAKGPPSLLHLFTSLGAPRDAGDRTQGNKDTVPLEELAPHWGTEQLSPGKEKLRERGTGQRGTATRGSSGRVP